MGRRWNDDMIDAICKAEISYANEMAEIRERRDKLLGEMKKINATFGEEKDVEDVKDIEDINDTIFHGIIIIGMILIVGIITWGVFFSDQCYSCASKKATNKYEYESRITK